MAYDTLLRKYEKGGLKLQDIEFKDRALKMKWVQKAYNNKVEDRTVTWMEVTRELLPYSLPEIFECNIKKTDLGKIGIKPEWSIAHVLKAWCSVKYKEPKSITEVLNQKIWYNSSIVRNKTPYLCKSLYQLGIMRIRDIYNVQDRFLSIQEVVHDFGLVQNYLEYYGIISDIPSKWCNILKTRREDNEPAVVNKLDSMVTKESKCTSEVYWYIVNQELNMYDHGKIIWQNELQCQWSRGEWESIRMYVF